MNIPSHVRNKSAKFGIGYKFLTSMNCPTKKEITVNIAKLKQKESGTPTMLIGKDNNPIKTTNAEIPKSASNSVPLGLKM